MSLHVAIQMDPIEKLDIIGDLQVLRSGWKPRQEVIIWWYYTPDQISDEEGKM